MKVDGGKSLTSLSTIDWYGMDVMNRRYEANEGGVSKFKYYWKNIKHAIWNPSRAAQKGSADWIAAYQTSNWATHSEEAHEKVKLDYGAYRIDNDKNTEYERAQEWGGANNPARATNKMSYSRATYGAGQGHSRFTSSADPRFTRS
jgi:diadenosine tetraphosphatase ApaH/serine/threonine PP2A family protein phosphatase